MLTATHTRLETRDLKPDIGAKILADKAALLSGVYAADIRELLETRGVLVFPQVHFTDAEQIAFTKTLGTFAPEMHDSKGEEKIHQITLNTSINPTANYLKGTFNWHFDGFANKQPIRASILTSKVLPPSGGNTGFCNTYAAYDALPDDRKAQIAGLRAVHALAATQLFHTPEPSHAEFKQWLGVGRCDLPLVWKHESGRQSLVIGSSAHHIVGMDPLDGLEILIYLRDWATQERFQYSHQWSVGDTVMWDNTGTLHRAEPYDTSSNRMLHRTKLAGEEEIL
jgi:alpha-ketoglutarate-dependent taurine dioxygenase